MLLKNCTLLYVEDDKDAQEHLKMILEDSVKEFYQAYDGEDGLALYRDKKPDIILTDVNMPISDGIEMSKKIKTIDRYQHIMVLSSLDDRKTLLNAINSGVDYFIPKPIDINTLEDRLNIVAKHLEYKKEVEELRRKEKKGLYNLAHLDSLTKIPNRYLFNLKLDQAISRAKRENSFVSLFFIDLDNFKNVNDTYGHLAGDRVLQSLSTNITNVIRVEDTFSRISGDEFTLIIESKYNNDYINIVAKKILGASSFSMKIEDETIHITCSIGISIYPTDAQSKEELIHCADTTMYKVKKSSKSDYEFFKKP